MNEQQKAKIEALDAWRREVDSFEARRRAALLQAKIDFWIGFSRLISNPKLWDLIQIHKRTYGQTVYAIRVASLPPPPDLFAESGGPLNDRT